MASEVIVTGSAGVLGRSLVETLRRRKLAVRGFGRGVEPGGIPAPWTSIDVASADQLCEPVRPGTILVHTASDPSRPANDVLMARNLLQLAKAAGVAHIVYVQVAGIGERAERASECYSSKIRAEAILRAGSVQCSTVAATQFHNLIDRVFGALALGPVLLRPPFSLQPVDPPFVAERVADHLRPLDQAGMIVCGPESLTSAEMASAWIKASRGQRLRAFNR